MRRILLFAMFLMFSAGLYAQTVVFSDNFESGTTNWVFGGTTTSTWGLSTTQAYSPTHSLSESPTGNYLDNQNITATMATGVNLSTYPSATLKFYTRYDIEAGFDYMYIDVSVNNFTSFTTIAVFDGTLNTWTQKTYDLGGFCGPGNTNVKIRFRFESDGGYYVDGMYIDNFEIISSSIDLSPPLILHTFPEFYKGSLNAHTVSASIVDYSGLASAKVNYWVDNVAQPVINGTNVTGTNWNFIIPAQPSGAWVKYVISATDSAPAANSAVSDTGRYIAGNYIYYDNGIVSYYYPMGPGGTTGNVGAATKITFGNTTLKTLLLRNYTDQNNPNDSMLIHVWSNASGLPGTDVIPPFKVKPEATLTNTSPMTRIDLRAYSTQLAGLQGDYFIGYDVPAGKCNTVYTSPGLAGRSFVKSAAGAWTALSGDFHFRAVTAADLDLVGPVILNNTTPLHYEASPGAQSINTQIVDNTGVDPATVKLYHLADGLAQTVINGIASGPDQYTFTIPPYPAGTMVQYWITASDLYTTPNASITDTFRYISGNYIKYDNNVINFYGTVGPNGSSGVLSSAVRVSLTGTAALTSILIRNYDGTGNATPTPPNSPMLVHVWANNAGLPGADLITPFTLLPVATVAKNSVFAVADMRPYATQLSNMTGDFFIGISVPSGVTNILMTQPGTFNRTFISDGVSWYPASGTTGISDYHFRCVTTVQTVGLPENTDASSFLVFPNPSNGEFTIAIDGASGNTLDIRVSDILGKQVYSLQEKGLPGSFNRNLDLSSLPKGMYILDVRNGDSTYTEKLIIR